MKKTYKQPQTLEIKVQSRHLILESIESTKVYVSNRTTNKGENEFLTKGDSWYDDDVWGSED